MNDATQDSMDRRSFLRKGACTICTCTALGGLAVSAAESSETKAPEDWRTPFVQARYAKLLEILATKLESEELGRTLQELGRFCAGKIPVAEKYRGNIELYIRESTEKSGERIHYDKGKGIITVTGPQRKDCFCPLVDHRKANKIVCDCSRGWLSQVYQYVLGQPVETRLLESVVHGGKCCAFEIRLLPKTERQA